MIVKCSPAEIQAVTALLQSPSKAKKETTQADVGGAEGAEGAVEEMAVNSDDAQCPVCTSSVEAPSITLLCGHSYCTSCFHSYLSSALSVSTGQRFPLKCFHKDALTGAECNTPFPIPTILSVLSKPDQDGLLEASFSAYIQSRPDEYSYCPTPDCATVYAVTPLTTTTSSSSMPPVFTCSHCFVGICTTCKSP